MWEALIGLIFGLSLIGEHRVESKISCYVCSWSNSSKQDPKLTDACSTNNFNPLMATIVDCDGGCESVGIRNSPNERFTNFYRNCLETSGRVIKDVCVGIKHKTHFEVKCDCLTDLCNGGIDNGPSLLPLIFIPIFFHRLQ